MATTELSELKQFLINKFESLDKKFESLDKKFESLENKFESLENKFDTLSNKVDVIEQNQNYMNKRLSDVLESNLRNKIAEKHGKRFSERFIVRSLYDIAILLSDDALEHQVKEQVDRIALHEYRKDIANIIAQKLYKKRDHISRFLIKELVNEAEKEKLAIFQSTSNQIAVQIDEIFKRSNEWKYSHSNLYGRIEKLKDAWRSSPKNDPISCSGYGFYFLTAYCRLYERKFQWKKYQFTFDEVEYDCRGEYRNLISNFPGIIKIGEIKSRLHNVSWMDAQEQLYLRFRLLIKASELYSNTRKHIVCIGFVFVSEDTLQQREYLNGDLNVSIKPIKI